MRALIRSPAAPELLCAPGNPGIGADARLLAIDVGDLAALADAAEQEGCDLVVIGPEGPLVAGLADELAARGIAAFGPSAAAARLEGSKEFAKEVMQAAGVPTATWSAVDDVEAGMAAIERYPVVLKFDGLAAGKGVVIAADEAEARDGAGGFPRRAPLRARPRRRRGVPRRRGALAAGAVRRRAGRCRWRPPRTTSGSSTATRGRTPAAWAPTRPCPASDPSACRSSRRSSTSRSSTCCASAARPFTACSTPGSCSPTGPLGARVQRALRRSRDAGRAAAAALGRLRAARRGRRPTAAAWRARSSSSTTAGR